MTDPDATGPDETDTDTIAALSLWPAVIHALQAGEQVAVVLAGPPSERRARLKADAAGEQPELLKAPYRRWVGDPGVAPGRAGIVGWATIDAAVSAEPLAEACIWLPAFVASAVGASATVVALRVEAPDGRPVLSDVAFEARLKSLVGKLPEGSWHPIDDQE